jgi:hypothetical protein
MADVHKALSHMLDLFTGEVHANLAVPQTAPVAEEA